MACKILYKGEYYDQNEFQTLLQDPNFAEQIRVSVMTDEFMKMWSDPSKSNMSAQDILQTLASNGQASFNITSEMQKVKAELVERDMKGISGEGKPIQANVKDKEPSIVSQWYTGSKIKNILKYFDHRIFRGAMKAELPEVYESYRAAFNFVNHSMYKVEKITKALNKLLDSNKNLLTKSDRLAITAILHGAGKDRLLLSNVSDPAVADALRQEIYDIAAEMRMHIDNLSEALINSGFLKESGVDIYLNNLGKYTARVYKTHLNPDDWWETLTGKSPDMAYVFNKGRTFVKKALEDRWTRIVGLLPNINRQIQALNTKRLTADPNNPFNKQDLIRLETLLNRKATLEGEISRLEAIILDDRLLDDYIKEMLSGKSGDVVTPGMSRINADLGLFKKRKEIPEEIRALLGEVTDPVELYATSVQRMASFLAKYEFQMNFALEGEGVLFSRTFDSDNGFTEKVPVGRMPGVRAMLGIGPDKHIYMLKPLAEDIKGAMGLEEDNPMGKAMSLLSTVNGLAKMNATVYNPGSQVRNFMGASTFMVVNGYVASRHFITSLTTLLAEVVNSTAELAGKKTSSELMDTVNEMAVQYGVLNSSVEIEEMKSLLGKDNRVVKFLDDFANGKGLTKPLNFIKTIAKLPVKTYQGVDNIFKVTAFLAEMDRNSRLYGYNSFREILNATKSTDATVAAKAKDAMTAVAKESGKVVRDTIPNYDEAYRFNKTLKNLPLIGVFTTFISETVRCTINSNKLLVEASKRGFSDPDPDKRRVYKEIAAYRLLGILVASSATLMQEELRSIIGSLFDDDDEDEKLKGKSKYVEVKGRDTFMKYFTPEWVKHVDLRRDPENPDGFIYSDPSTINPYSLWKQRAFERTTKGGMSVAYDMVSPILGPVLSPEIGFKFLTNLLSKKDMYGESITPYTIDQDPAKFLRDVLGYTIFKGPVNPLGNMMKTLGGDYMRLSDRIKNDEELLENTSNPKEREKIQDRIRQAQYKIQEAGTLGMDFIMMSGYKSNYVDLTVQAGFKAYEAADRVQEFKDTYNKRKGESADIDKLYNEMNSNYQRELDNLKNMIKETRENLGINVGPSVIEVLGKKRFSRKELSYIKGHLKTKPDLRLKDYETRSR